MSEPAASDISSRIIVGGIAGFLGIVVGAVLAFLHIESLGDVLSPRPYGHWMLVPFGLAALAFTAAIAEAAIAKRLRLATVVVGVLGLLALASPFSALIAVVTIIGVIVGLAKA